MMSHAAMPREVRHERGITDGLLRYSVGLEDIDDLIADLEQALDEMNCNIKRYAAALDGLAAFFCF